nr:hypothetical protein [Tanacetum cinerariifolium]
RQIDDENVPLNYYINNDLHIQFGREKFCLVTGLRFGVKNKEEYDTQANLSFRRREFSSHLDGKPITGIDIANAIAGPTFAELYDDDVGNIPAVRLTPDDNEARSDWWISSKAYFDGFIDQVDRVPFDLSRQNMYEIPSHIYRQFVEQKIELERNRKDVDDIKEQMLEFREEMNARPVRQENTVPINVGKHYGFSDFSQFQSMQMSEQSASHYWQPSPQPGFYYSFGQVPSHIGRPNLQTTIETQHDVDGIVDQRVSKTKHNGKKANLSPLNLGGVLEGYNEEVPVTFWQEFAPHLCMPDMQRHSYGTLIGWLGGEMELMIRRRPLNANWTVAYTSTISVHPENNQFIILKDPHVIGTLDGSTRLYPSWNDVDWVFLSMHVAGNHWATGVIHLANSHFYVFDSMFSACSLSSLYWLKIPYNRLELWMVLETNIDLMKLLEKKLL